MAEIRIPNRAQLLDSLLELDFADSEQGKVLSGTTAWEAYVALTAEQPKELDIAFRVRDKIAGWLKDKPIGGFAKKSASAPPAGGSSVDFFTVESIRDSQLVLSAASEHREVMVSVDVSAPNPNSPPTRLDVTVSANAFTKTGKFQVFMLSLTYGFIVRKMLANIKAYQLAHPPAQTVKTDDPFA